MVYTNIRPALLKLLATVLSAAAVLVIAEMIARRTIEPMRVGYGDFYVLDPEVGYTYPPEERDPGFELFGKFIDHPFVTNNQGLKGAKNFPVPPSGDELRVLAIGDSTANLMHVDSWPEFLNGILTEALPTRNVWVQNAGVMGFSSENVWRMARREIPRFKPDYMVLTLGMNDADMSDAPDSDDFKDSTFGETIARTGQHFRLVTGARANLPAFLVHQFTDPTFFPGTKTPRVPLDRFRRNIETIISDARAAGARPILTLYPWLFWNEEQNWMWHVSDYGPYLQTLRDLAREQNVPLVDMVTPMRRPDRAAFYTVTADDRNTSFGMRLDNYHLNHAGAEWLAGKIAEIIAKDVEAKSPSLDIESAPINHALRWQNQTPESEPDFLNFVAPEAFWRAETPRMEQSNREETARDRLIYPDQ